MIYEVTKAFLKSTITTPIKESLFIASSHLLIIPIKAVSHEWLGLNQTGFHEVFYELLGNPFVNHAHVFLKFWK